LNRDNVTSLDLTGAKGQMGQVEMERLANALCKTNISRLSLEDCGLSDECYWEIGLLVRASPQLVELNL
jgi:hypothetical protein